jgi:hypothetical protein
MIDEAMQPKPGRPVGTQMAGASGFTVHRADADAEAAELRKAGRTAVRLALGGHDCTDLPACPVHGQELCGCNPCTHPSHDADAELLADALQAIGVRDTERDTRRTCDVCGKDQAISRYARHGTTCKDCLTAAKHAADDAEEADRVHP